MRVSGSVAHQNPVLLSKMRLTFASTLVDKPGSTTPVGGGRYQDKEVMADEARD